MKKDFGFNSQCLTLFSFNMILKVEDMLTKDELDDFLTSVCYPHILATTFVGDPDTIASKL